MVDMMKALNGDSWLAFNWDANNECTSFNVTTASWSEPKVR
jgi:hypothetical protein